MEPPMYGKYRHGGDDEMMLSDGDESFGPPPPPPEHAHPDDLHFENNEVNVPSVDGDGDKFNDEYSEDYHNQSAYADVESSGTHDPPEEKPLEEDEADVNDLMAEYDEDVDFEEDQSVEIPPTSVVQRMVMQENEDKTGENRNKGIMACLCCCLIIGLILIIVGFTTDMFKDSETKSVATANDGEGGTTTTPPTDSAPAASPAASPTVPDTRTADVSAFLRGVSMEPSAFDEVDSSATLAANWLSLEDSLELDPTSADDQFRMTQRFALLAGFWFASFDDWNSQSGWAFNEDECTWDGIVCSEVNVDGVSVQAVTEIYLFDNNLQGLSEEIGLLPYVKILNIRGNVIESPMPQSIVNMNLLEELYIYDNLMTGEWPSDLSALSSLRKLDASNNQFSGPVNRFFDLTAVDLLVLDKNQFTGNLNGVGNCVNLVRLTISENSLTGGVNAELSNLVNLEFLWLYSNGLTGSIPDEIGTMPALQVFDVFNNDLSGGLPTTFVDSPSLQVLTLADNNFGGQIPDAYGQLKVGALNIENCGLTGAINPELAKATALVSLRLAENNFDSAEFPDFILGMTNLVELRLNDCNIQGSIPTNIDDLSLLQILYLHNNFFGDVLPPRLGNLADLRMLNLSNQFLTGAVPQRWSRLTKLVSIDLSDNPSLEGGLPDISGMQALEELKLARTNLGEDITGTTYFIDVPSLKYIDLTKTAITGRLPNNWGLLQSLEELRLADNGLTGQIPRSLRAVETLRVLILTGNALRGTIPDGFFDFLTELRILQLNRNELSGALPEDISNSFRLQFLSIAENRDVNGDFGFVGPLPDSLGDLVNLREFECQGNQIGGELPEDMGQFLVNLEILDISNNQLSGNIPGSFASMTSLTEFFLDGNNFETAWPENICNISTLSIIKPDCDIACPASCCNREAC
mmetsp:Transcript_21982/g.51758  ORF Transcript_21982/g.51758 Transcript_21982/m.51758 type:complete len:919 (-) Transcript_21982:101-2857(-)